MKYLQTIKWLLFQIIHAKNGLQYFKLQLVGVQKLNIKVYQWGSEWGKESVTDRAKTTAFDQKLNVIGSIRNNNINSNVSDESISNRNESISLIRNYCNGKWKSNVLF